MNNSMILFQKHGLINANVSFSEVANAFLTTGYTSAAGNTYFNSIRVAEGILIKEAIGKGYAHTFLNGLKIYSIKDKTLIADISFNTVYYSVSTVKAEAKMMLLNMLEKASKNEGYKFDYDSAEVLIDKLLTTAFNSNQMELLKQQTKKYLLAS
jgi:hypothetical protein